MKISLGIIKEIDFNFWVNSNDFYSPDILSTDGLNHTKKAGLINDLIKTLNSNEELIKLIEQRIYILKNGRLIFRQKTRL